VDTRLRTPTRLPAPRARIIAVAFLALTTMAHASPATPPLPAEVAVLGRLPSIEHVAISPDGRRLAFVTTGDGDERIVAVVSVADGKVAATARAGDTKLRYVRWLDDDHVLLATSNASGARGIRDGWGEWMMLHVFELRTKKVRQLLTGATDGTMNVATGRPMVRRVDGSTVVFVETLYDGEGTRMRPALVAIDLATGREKVVARGDLETDAWLVDPSGEIAAEMRYDDRGQEWAVRLRRNGSLREVTSGKAAFGGGELLGFDPDGDRIWVRLPEDDVTDVAGPLSEKSGSAWNVSPPRGTAQLSRVGLEAPPGLVAALLEQLLGRLRRRRQGTRRALARGLRVAGDGPRHADPRPRRRRRAGRAEPSHGAGARAPEQTGRAGRARRRGSLAVAQHDAAGDARAHARVPRAAQSAGRRDEQAPRVDGSNRDSPRAGVSRPPRP